MRCGCSLSSLPGSRGAWRRRSNAITAPTLLVAIALFLLASPYSSGTFCCCKNATRLQFDAESFDGLGPGYLVGRPSR